MADKLSNTLSDHIANLETVDTKVVYSPSYCYLRKKAGVVYVYGHSAGGLQLTGDGQWHSLTTIPSGYRPADDVYFAGANATGVAISFHISTNGTIEYVLNANTSYWNYGASYLV